MYRILIVEDDDAIAAALEKHFAAWGMACRRAEDLRHVMEAFRGFSPHLVLLDILLPFYDGYHWCREIRAVSRVPILFLSSAGDNMNIGMAIQAGADDFVTKPFDLSVLNAKVQALLRRAYDFGDGVHWLECRGLLLNPGDSTASYGGESFPLTRNEHRILQVLLENRGRIVSRETLMRRLWETDSFVDENTLTVNVARLRRKLADHGVPDLIATRKGEGYLMEGEA